MGKFRRFPHSSGPEKTTDNDPNNKLRGSQKPVSWKLISCILIVNVIDCVAKIPGNDQPSLKGTIRLERNLMSGEAENSMTDPRQHP